MIPAIVVRYINDFLIYLLLGYDVPSETRGEHTSWVGVGCHGTTLKDNNFIRILIDREILILLMIGWSIPLRIRVVPRGHK